MKKFYSFASIVFCLLLLADQTQAQSLDLEIKNVALQKQVVPSRGLGVPFLAFELTAPKDVILKEILVKQTGLSSNKDIRSVAAEVAGSRSPSASVNNDGVARIQFVRGIDLYAGEAVLVRVLATLQTVSSRTIGFDLINVVTEAPQINASFSQRRIVRPSISEVNKTRSSQQPVATKATQTVRATTLNARERLILLRQRMKLINTLTINSKRRTAQSRAQGRQLLQSRRTGIGNHQFSNTNTSVLQGRSRSLDDLIANTKLRNSIIQVQTLDNGFDLTAGTLQKVIEFDLTNTEQAANRINNLYFENETGQALTDYFKGFELRNRKGIKVSYTEDINNDKVRFYFNRGYRLQVNNSGVHSLWGVPKKSATAETVQINVIGSD